MTDTFTYAGITYREIPCTSFGDYGGDGSVGLANIRALESDAESKRWDSMDLGFNDIRDLCEESPKGSEHLRRYADTWNTIRDIAELLDCIDRDQAPEMLQIYGGYSSRAIWLRSDIAEEYLTALEQYPCLNDEIVSEVELEWENEAWESWLKSDLLRGLSDDDEPIENLPDGTLFECYRQAMESCNEYPTPELNGVHVDVERIRESFLDFARRALPAAVE